MDSRQAKEILARFRPGDTNTSDPRMAEALELAQRDPQLAIWFGKHCANLVKLPGEPPAFVATVPSTALANRERDAAAAAAAAAAAPAPAPEIDRLVPLNKTALVMMFVAALVLVAAFLYARYVPPLQNNFQSFRDRMGRLVQRSYPVKMSATNQVKVRDYFRANGGVLDFAVSRRLANLPAIGGAVLAWHNQPVSLLALDGGGSTNLYLFLSSRSAFEPETLPAAGLQLHRVGRLMTASWMTGDTVYLFAAPNDEALVKYYLEP